MPSSSQPSPGLRRALPPQPGAVAGVAERQPDNAHAAPPPVEARSPTRTIGSAPSIKQDQAGQCGPAATVEVVLEIAPTRREQTHPAVASPPLVERDLGESVGFGLFGPRTRAPSAARNRGRRRRRESPASPSPAPRRLPPRSSSGSETVACASAPGRSAFPALQATLFGEIASEQRHVLGQVEAPIHEERRAGPRAHRATLQRDADVERPVTAHVVRSSRVGGKGSEVRGRLRGADAGARRRVVRPGSGCCRSFRWAEVSGAGAGPSSRTALPGSASRPSSTAPRR